jgi:hypothetical protein
VPPPAVARLREVTLWFSPEYTNAKPRAEQRTTKVCR